MFDDAVCRLLDLPGLPGVVCTTRADGSPQANAVWFRRQGDEIRIWTDEQRRWVANARRDVRVAFSVHEDRSPWSSVSLRGRARLMTVSLAETLREIRRITARYLPADDVEAYIEAWPHTRSVVAVEVTAAFAAQAFEDPVAHRRT